jgi:hypothetical protein
MYGLGGKCGYPRLASPVQVPTVVNGEAITEVGYVLGTSADNFRSAYLEAAFVENLVSFLGLEIPSPGATGCSFVSQPPPDC